MREVLDAAPGLVNPHAGWAPRFAERPVTKYEARGLAAGRAVHDLEYRPVPRVGDLVHRRPHPGPRTEVPL